jgi:predicted aldo/keto reductase-like oxidoreductase
VDIPRVLRMADAGRHDGDLAGLRQQYDAWHDAWWRAGASASAPAAACVACGDCLARCPASLPIPRLLAEARDLLSA